MVWILFTKRTGKLLYVFSQCFSQRNFNCGFHVQNTSNPMMEIKISETYQKLPTSSWSTLLNPWLIQSFRNRCNETKTNQASDTQTTYTINYHRTIRYILFATSLSGRDDTENVAYHILIFLIPFFSMRKKAKSKILKHSTWETKWACPTTKILLLHTHARIFNSAVKQG